MEDEETRTDPPYVFAMGEECIARLTLSRPARLNALTWEAMEAIGERLDAVRVDRSVRLLIVTGAGRGFCSGLDVSKTDPLGSDDDILEVLRRQELVANLMLKLRRLPMPVIAAVNGPATGAGLALALAADVRVCSESAVFGAAFVRLGISACDVGVSYLLPRLVGHGHASEMMLTGNLVDAEMAFRIGLVNRVAPADGLIGAAEAMARDIVRNSPYGVRMTKSVLALSTDATSIEQAVELENRTQVIGTRTEDAREAVAAFQAERPANFNDR